MTAQKKPRRRRRRRLLVAASLLTVGIAALCLVTPACAVLREAVSAAPSPPSEDECQHGTFRRVKGVGVLTLWGTPYERGFAHGKLLARGVVEMVDVVCGSNLLLSHTDDYEETILPLMDRFAFAPDDEAELRGLLDGVQAALGPEPMLPRIGRALTLDDLKAYNAAGDWYRQACSSFAAWGERARQGHVWVGRNFDFLPTRAFLTYQMFVVHRRHGEKKAWASVTAPGMIGAITGVNEHGVFTAVHDVFLPLRPLETGYTPRLLVLRRLLERCEPRDLEAQARPLLEARKQMFDNAILLAAPVTDGTPPALVFEYNNDRSTDRGVTVRRPADNSPALSRQMIACTNHFRKRVEPAFNLTYYRYPLMRRVLMAKTEDGTGVDFDTARKALGAVRLPITVHTAILDLNALDLWFASGDFLLPPGNRDFVKLPLKQWLTAK
jgi:hypothetical protein